MKDYCMCGHKIKPGKFIEVDKFNPLTCAICKKEFPFSIINVCNNYLIEDNKKGEGK